MLRTSQAIRAALFAWTDGSSIASEEQFTIDHQTEIESTEGQAHLYWEEVAYFPSFQKTSMKEGWPATLKAVPMSWIETRRESGGRAYSYASGAEGGN